MSQLQVFENELFKVSAKTEDEQILFDAEQVAKSLGFTETKGNKLYVRWRSINGYLDKYISQHLAKGDFIPEPLVYKLAFKASNEVAEKFQDWLAIEVIPAIRRTGSYELEKPKSELEILQGTVNELVSQDKRITNLEETMRIDGGQEFQIRSKANSVVIEALGGKESSAYNQLSRKAFTEFWRDFKKHFSLPRYGDLPKKQFEDGLRFIDMWQPSTGLRIEIENANKQQTMRVI
ncbi:hypothetical protein GCM10008986_16340 [Salinibacillus aidingensis]|uniref:Bro-N domain-containing protein n=1 Tax=Salinibacillus aidingensis TaxID=237684 RepID=A0ABN1B6G3_9BACI